MTKREYSHPFPAELVTHATAICGDRGRAWLDELPSTISELEQQWSIEVAEPFPAGEYNFVAPVFTSDGQRTVIKIAPPFETNEIIGEAAFLRHRAGCGAVELLDEDIERRAILIERLLPGKNLAQLFTGNEELAVQPAIEVLRSILGPPPNNTVTSLDDWFKALHRHGATDFPASYAEKALNLYDKLSSQPGRTFYLHGDYHPGNVINATRSPYLAIDPKGLIGHIGYDIAVFLNNFHWWQETESDVRDRLAVAVEQFSDAFDIDPLELRQWAYAQMVLGAWWTFDEMHEHYENEVAKADVWDV